MKVAVDFDGTICRKVKWPKMGPPVPGAVEWMKVLHKAGAKLILYTMRSGKTLDEAVNYIEGEEVELYSVNSCPGQHTWSSSPKVYAHAYVDDAAVGCPLIRPKEGEPYVDWGEVGPILLAKLKAGKHETPE